MDDAQVIDLLMESDALRLMVRELAAELDIRCDAHDDDRLMDLLARAKKMIGVAA